MADVGRWPSRPEASTQSATGPRNEAIYLLDTALQECLSEYCMPNEFGGYDTNSREAAVIVVDTLLANPDVLEALTRP